MNEAMYPGTTIDPVVMWRRSYSSIDTATPNMNANRTTSVESR